MSDLDHGPFFTQPLIICKKYHLIGVNDEFQYLRMQDNRVNYVKLS